MLRVVSKEQKKLNIKSDYKSEVTQDGTLCLVNIQITNSYASSIEVIVSDVRIKIAYLESQSTMTRIMSKLEKEESFLMKFIDIKFYGYSEIKIFLSNLQSL